MKKENLERLKAARKQLKLILEDSPKPVEDFSIMEVGLAAETVDRVIENEKEGDAK
jgi:hypothetical protein